MITLTKISKILSAIAGLFLLSAPSFAQTQFNLTEQVTTTGYTVATLPASPAGNPLAIITDGNGASCTSGGSTSVNICRWTGAAWVYVGSTAAANPAGTAGQLQFNNSGSFGGVSVPTGIVKSAPGTPPTLTAAASTDVIGLWTGTCNSTTFLRADGSCQVAGAITLQTNAVNNTSQSTLSLANSSTNSTGLTATFTNTNSPTGTVQLEIGGTLTLASLVAPSTAGDAICANSTPTWADCVLGISGRVTATSPDSVGAGDRLSRVGYNSASALTSNIASAASLGNNFATTIFNENSGADALTPGAGLINAAASISLPQGSWCNIASSDNTNYTALCSAGLITTDTSLTPTRSAFGLQLGLAATSFPFSGGQAGTSFQDVTETAGPGNPTAGNDRLYLDSTTHLLTCLTSSGGSCLGSGGASWSGITDPTASVSHTMAAFTTTFTYNAATGAGVNLITLTDTANNTGNGNLLRVGTAAGSAASALSLFATGSSTNTFGNPFAEVISNPTAATASQAQSSPKWEICGRTWSGGTPADTPECFSWQVVPGSNSSNPVTSLTLAHESGTTNVQSLNLPLANFTLSVAAIAVGNSIVNTTNNGVTTIQGGKDSNGVSGNLVARGGAVSGGSSAVAAGGGLFQGGNDASTSATSSAGGVELLAGAATGATQGLQGLLATVPVYVKGATVTQWNLETESAQMTVADAGASPGYWLCVAEVVGTNTVQCINDGETAVNASAAVTLGHTVCAGTTAGKVTDSGGTAACTLGTGVGVVMATSGTWKFPDGTSVTASTTLPIIQIVRD